MEEKEKTLVNLLKEDIFTGQDKEKVVRKLLVRLPKEQENYWAWENPDNTDMEALEAVLRRWEEALEILFAMDGVTLEYQLADMQFQMLNIVLFYKYEMISEAKPYMEKAMKHALAALNCFIDKNGKTMISTENEAYAVRESWNCILTFCTLFELEAKQGELEKAGTAVKTASEYLKILKPYLVENPGLCDMVARKIWSMSGIMSDYGDSIGAGKLQNEAGEIYHELFEKYESAYAKAMYLYMEILKLISQFSAGTIDCVHLNQLHDEEWKLRSMPDATEFEKKIADELSIMIEMCIGFVKLSEDKAIAAVAIFETQEERIRDCITYFEQLRTSENQWMAYWGAEFAQRLHGFQIICGIQSAEFNYFADSLTDAKKKFEGILESMENYLNVMPELQRLRITSRIYGMMGDICCRNGDLPQAEFYFERNVSVSEKLASLTKLVQDWGNYAHSCLFAVEFFKSLKKNDAAKSYAQKGLLACEKIRSLDSGHKALALEKTFEKALVAKKGFFSRWF